MGHLVTVARPAKIESTDSSAMEAVRTSIGNVAISCEQFDGFGKNRHWKFIHNSPDKERIGNKWRIRVCTDPNITAIDSDGALSPYRGESSNDSTEFVYSMLRLTEHGDRLHFTEIALDAGLLPQSELRFRDDLKKHGACQTPVPHTISSGAFKNVVPLIFNFMDRLDGLNVGRMVVLVFNVERLDRNNHRRLHLPEKPGKITMDFENMLQERKVQEHDIAKWISQVQACAERFTEEHHYDLIPIEDLLANGDAFFITFDNASFHDYAIVAKHAALRAERRQHGGSELMQAISNIVEQQLQEKHNPTLRLVNEHVLANLRMIHKAAGFFWIEDSAYKEAKGAPFNNQVQVHKSTGNGKHILLLLGIIFLLLRTRIRK